MKVNNILFNSANLSSYPVSAWFVPATGGYVNLGVINFPYTYITSEYHYGQYFFYVDEPAKLIKSLCTVVIPPPIPNPINIVANIGAGSVVVDYVATATYAPDTDVTITFTHALSTTRPSPVLFGPTLRINSGMLTGTLSVTSVIDSYFILTKQCDFYNEAVIMSTGSSAYEYIMNYSCIFANVPTPTPSPSPSPSPTPTPFALPIDSANPQYPGMGTPYVDNGPDLIYMIGEPTYFASNPAYVPTFYYYNDPPFDPNSIAPHNVMTIYINGTLIASVDYSPEREGMYFGFSLTGGLPYPTLVGVFTDDVVSGGGVYFTFP